MLSIEAYQSLVDPMEAILAETDRIAKCDQRRFSAEEVYARVKDRINARERVHA